MGGACGSCEKRNAYRTLTRMPERKNILKDLVIFGTIILKYILKKLGRPALTSFSSGYRRVVGFFEDGDETSCFIKYK